MAKLFISKRAIFHKGKQREFILQAKKELSVPDIKLAQLFKISNRTLTDWKKERFSMSLEAIKIISKKTGQKLPKDIEIKDPFWYVFKGAKIGGLATYKKYGKIGGDLEQRKKKWREWWEREGKYKKHPIINVRLPIKRPKKSEELAEFVGIVMGDGGITQRQVTVTLHRKDDKEYASQFIIPLIKRLFNVPVGVHYSKRDLSVDFVISRSELVRFCVEELGLKIGNKIKQQIDIPDWIKTKKQYSIACVRGLVDTDGSVFKHTYKVNNKSYSYKKLNFTSHSKPLCQSVLNILRGIGLNSRLSREKDIWLDSVKDMENYFKIISSHNPKHLKRYLK